GDHRILFAEAQELGYVVVPIENNPPPCDVELLTLHARWTSDIGQVNGAIADTFEDAVITSDEHGRIRKRFFDATRTGLTYLLRMGGLAQ
ncbi:MAG: hypothetical protein KDC18_19375, partial [Alphaproteobacteria bacterium]|nr:hypothetical protein [Alphaproteobacteria bacterium]